MFNNVSPREQEVDDIFSETDKAPAPTPAQSAGQVPGAAYNSPANYPQVGVSPAGSPSAAYREALADDEGKKSSAAKILKGMLIVILGLGLVVGAAYAIYSQILVKKFSPSNNLNNVASTSNETQTTGDNNPVQPVITETPATTTEIATSSEIVTDNGSSTQPEVTPAKVDSDNDGLSDTEEAIVYKTNPNLSDTDGDGLNDGEEVNTYKTDPNLADSDSDGLSDYQEVKTYNTNPNNPDTDGDTYKDGAEVSGGYNPNGTGNLIK